MHLGPPAGWNILWDDMYRHRPLGEAHPGAAMAMLADPIGSTLWVLHKKDERHILRKLCDPVHLACRLSTGFAGDWVLVKQRTSRNTCGVRGSSPELGNRFEEAEGT
jgi:hypothetical protein